jgi:hypothetical protein
MNNRLALVCEMVNDLPAFLQYNKTLALWAPIFGAALGNNGVNPYIV